MHTVVFSNNIVVFKLEWLAFYSYVKKTRVKLKINIFTNFSIMWRELRVNSFCFKLMCNVRIIVMFIVLFVYSIRIRAAMMVAKGPWKSICVLFEIENSHGLWFAIKCTLMMRYFIVVRDTHAHTHTETNNPFFI